MANVFFLALLMLGLHCLNFRSIQSINFDSWTYLDHDSYSGDDNGGIASGPGGDEFVYSGDYNSVLFEIQVNGSLSALSIPQIDGIFSDLRNGQYYTFTDESGAFFSDGDTIRGFVPLYRNGTAMGAEVFLSSPITEISQFNYEDGVLFLADADYCHISKWHNSTRITGSTYSIDLATGEVTETRHEDLRAIFFNGTRYAETWAAYGFAEHYYDVNGDYMFAVASCIKDSPARVGLCKYDIMSSVPTEQAFIVFEFENGTFVDILDEVASVAISPFNADVSRFYMHYEGSYNLGSGSENAGYALAMLEDTTPPVTSSTVVSSTSRSDTSSAADFSPFIFA